MRLAKRLLALFIGMVMVTGLAVGCADGNASHGGTRTITDMAGREVTIPEDVNTAFSSGAVAAIFIYMVAPDKLLNWNYDLNATEKAIILEKYHDLPNFGQGDGINYEAVIAAAPDIAIACGTINDALVSSCDEMSEKLGIPVVAVDSDLDNSSAALRFVGEVLGEEEQAERLAAYAEKTFDDIAALSEIPEEKKVCVYYGNGEDSLETAPNGSSHAEILDKINAINVAELELGDGSRVQISAEQLLKWDPDVIIVNGEPKSNISGGSAAEAILNNPDYASIKAVRELKVYGTPNAPFSWVDRPPGPNRIIGMRYFSVLVYPDYIGGDVNAEIHEFFELFYHIDLSDEQMENLLGGTLA